MIARNQLQVHVNAELILNAGTCEEIAGSHGQELFIRPPETTLFHQVLACLCRGRRETEPFQPE
jgi:hypothetical protein